MSTVTENVDRELMLPITLPSGVSASDVTVVNVRVTLSTIDTRTIEDVTLNAHDNYNNLAISNIDFTTVNVEVRGSTNNIDSVEASDIEVYFIMPQEPGSYKLELFAELNNHPFVDISLEKSTVNVTVVEANQ